MELHFERVHALCRRILCDDFDAEDATQDALVAAVRALGRFDGRSSFSTWLYRITTNVCIDELRRRRRRPLLDMRDGALDMVSGAASGGASGVSGGGIGAGSGTVVRDPADVTAAKVDVDEALKALPPEFRVAVVLRDMCDLSYEEIALSLEIPVGTVRSRIARGRAAIAVRLEGQGSAPASCSSSDGKSPSGNTAELPNVQTP